MLVEHDLDANIVPSNVRDLVVSRLDGLPASHLMTAKVASVTLAKGSNSNIAVTPSEG